MLRRLTALAAAGLLAGAAAACAPDNDPGDGGDGPAVVAAFYPLEFVATRLGADVSGLAPPGVEAHDLELSPSQVAEITDADLVVYLSGFQPAVDEAVAEHAGRAFNVTSVVDLIEAEEHDEHGDEEHEGEEEGHEEEDDHDHGPEDPHVWLDPLRLAIIGDGLAEELAAVDPDRADDYTSAAAELRTDLAALDTEYADGLAECERREIVVSHAAFGYLADRYDLRQIAITGLTPEDEPSPQQLQEVIHETGEVGATTIFFEVLVAPDVAQTIATAVEADTAVLDPIEGLAPGSDEDYLSLMRQNLAALQTALGCT